jgi:hypothetical protein
VLADGIDPKVMAEAIMGCDANREIIFQSSLESAEVARIID